MGHMGNPWGRQVGKALWEGHTINPTAAQACGGAGRVGVGRRLCKAEWKAVPGKGRNGIQEQGNKYMVIPASLSSSQQHQQAVQSEGHNNYRYVMGRIIMPRSAW